MGSLVRLYFSQELQIYSFTSTGTVLQDIGFGSNPSTPQDHFCFAIQLHSHSSTSKETATLQHRNKQLGTKWGEQAHGSQLCLQAGKGLFELEEEQATSDHGSESKPHFIVQTARSSFCSVFKQVTCLTKSM